MQSNVKPQKFLIKTLGCKANLADSQLLESELQKQGWEPLRSSDQEGDATLVIVNSCTVTDEADRQSLKMAKDFKAGATVVYTGCGAEVSPDQITQAHWVVGNQDKHRLAELVTTQFKLEKPTSASAVLLGGVSSYGELKSRHPMDREWPLPEQTLFLPEASPKAPLQERSESSRTRSFLKIQEGCNAFCTYCIIPYGRGPSRSLPIDRCITHVNELVTQGAQEVVITGTNIGDYGIEWGKFGLCDLLNALLKETKIARIRLGSLDPVEITQELLDLISLNARICPHLHVSLQSPLSKILKLMKRKYSTEHVEQTLQAIEALELKYPNAPVGGVYVGMDIITGFPGETSDDFDQTLKLMNELPWTRLHVFPFSERSGTPATRLMAKVPEQQKSARSKQLRSLSHERLMSHYRQILLKLKEAKLPLTQVLVEGLVKGPDGKKEWRSGYTPNYLRVIFKPENDANRALALNQVIDLNPTDLLIDRPGSEAAFISV